MNEFLKELIKRAGIFFLLLGLILLVLAANGTLPLAGANPFSAMWVVILAIGGGLLALAGAVMTVVEWRASLARPGEMASAAPLPLNGKLDPGSLRQLGESGVIRTFRIPDDNPIRLDRVCHLIKEEVSKGNGHLRLTASSGYSYLSPHGPVWKSASIGGLIESGKIRQLEVILESPFTFFAETRAIANNVPYHQWEDRQMILQLVKLLKYPNVSLRVTSECITCSLFFTSKAVFYDPYLWSLPDELGRTENNFWVFEFEKITDPNYARKDCYSLLEGHFEFLRRGSVPLENLLHTPAKGSKVPRNEHFWQLFEKNPKLALNNYDLLTKKFSERIKSRVREKTNGPTGI